MDGTALAIVEVRYRASDRFGGAAASITAGKAGHIIRAARALLATNPPLAKLPARFDVVEVSGSVDNLDLRPDPRRIQPLACIRSRERGGGDFPKGGGHLY